jgi:hypothetical protein
MSPKLTHVLRALTDKPQNLKQIITAMGAWGPGWEEEITEALDHLVQAGRVKVQPVKSTGTLRWLVADE